MKETKELKEELELLQGIIAAYDVLNRLKRESNELDKKYIPDPVYQHWADPHPYIYR